MCEILTVDGVRFPCTGLAGVEPYYGSNRGVGLDHFVAYNTNLSIIIALGARTGCIIFHGAEDPPPSRRNIDMRWGSDGPGLAVRQSTSSQYGLDDRVWS